MTILMLVTCVSFTVLWGCATFLVPSHVNSLFRYKLWKLRDDLEDHVFYGRLPRSTVVRELLTVIEELIRCSDDLKLSDYLAQRFTRNAQTQPEGILRIEIIETLPESQRKLLLLFVDQVTDAVMLKLVMAGPFGWPVFLAEYALGTERLCSLVFWLFSTKRRGPEELRKAELRRLRQLHDVATWKQRGRGQGLEPLANHAA